MWGILNRIKEYFFPKETMELKSFNPIGLKVGSHIHIDSLDVRSVDFTLESIQVIDRFDAGHFGKIADYVLCGRNFSTNEDLNVVLRFYDSSSIDRILALLEKVSSFGFDEEIYNKLNNKKDLSIEFEGESYWRINDLQTPWECKTQSFIDINKDSFVEEKEVISDSLKIWDYWRELEDENIEFLYVQMDSNGFFEMYRGQRITESQIEKR